MEAIRHRMVEVNGINIHIAEKGKGPVILFLHGFPELWYSWRHQILALSNMGYRTVAPDLRGYGYSDIPESVDSYTCFHIVGDLVELIDVLDPHERKVFVVGHDWGAILAWFLCLFRPDKVKALVNLSVPFLRFDRNIKPVELWRAYYGSNHYISRFQEYGEIEGEFAWVGTDRVENGLVRIELRRNFLLIFQCCYQKGNYLNVHWMNQLHCLVGYLRKKPITTSPNSRKLASLVHSTSTEI
ncbi:hypothetical protein E1A91_D13G260900v1 [Gossypium mustelinum]|uniref:AB hydrolase-1 domain-containing protein n=1 Tax=Gossypium mustelinum TaxID=34275 RepID=A0A5D2S6P2_GOSMU|nr:hypothetical protein E1A91_D13G260900v1 [Gossypium mustelinum]